MSHKEYKTKYDGVWVNHKEDEVIGLEGFISIDGREFFRYWFEGCNEEDNYAVLLKQDKINLTKYWEYLGEL